VISIDHISEAFGLVAMQRDLLCTTDCDVVVVAGVVGGSESFVGRVLQTAASQPHSADGSTERRVIRHPSAT